MTKININKAAIAQFAGNTKARLRIIGGVLQIRPTARKSGVKLPKGEVLVDVKRMGFFNQIDLQAAFGDRGFDIPTAGVLAAAKHGWLTLDQAGDNAPTIKAV
jgi:hypothetical protein